MSSWSMLRAIVLALALFGGWPGAPAHALLPDEILADKALEKRARELSAGLRCLVCQNQSIDDSDAPLARDLRLLVRERLVAGDSNSEVRDFVVARYGDFVLLKPPFSPATFLLWAMPLLALFGAGVILWTSFRPQSQVGSQQAGSADPGRSLSIDEQEKLDALMKRDHENN